MRFDGKHVVVTGASRGIGRAVAEAFASAGARLTILADDPAITQAAKEIARSGSSAVSPIHCDIADRAAVQAAFAGFDAVDVLVNNAGLERLTPVRSTDAATLDTYHRIIDINVNGSFWVTHAVLPHMKRGGRIIFTASIWGKSVEAEFAAYCASKHAVIGLTRVLAKELGKDGITVNAVCPGYTDTDILRASVANVVGKTGRSEADALAEFSSANPQRRIVQPAEVADAVRWLCGEGAASVTGQSVSVSGGEVM